MDGKEKDKAPHTETSEPEAALNTQSAETVGTAEEPAPPNHTNSLAQKRGRMVAAGGLTAVILAIVAVVVAGVFGLTSAWLKVCPTDLPVNDPAKYLSGELISEKADPRPLGVSGSLAEQTRLKGAEPPRSE